jgi:hypothetical protein
MLPLTTRSSPVTARICASIALRSASRLTSQELATKPASASPSSAAIGVPRRLIPWAMVTDISWMSLGSLVPEDGQRTPKTRANINNLTSFLDAFKAVPLLCRDCGGSLSSHRNIPDDASMPVH